VKGGLCSAFVGDARDRATLRRLTVSGVWRGRRCMLDRQFGLSDRHQLTAHGQRTASTRTTRQLRMFQGGAGHRIGIQNACGTHSRLLDPQKCTHVSATKSP
jgi:hypothetical protein